MHIWLNLKSILSHQRECHYIHIVANIKYLFNIEYKIRNDLNKICIKLIEKWFRYLFFFFLEAGFSWRVFFIFQYLFIYFWDALIISLSKNKLLIKLSLQFNQFILYNYLYPSLSKQRATLFTNWHRNLPDFSIITKIYGFPISR